MNIQILLAVIIWMGVFTTAMLGVAGFWHPLMKSDTEIKLLLGCVIALCVSFCLAIWGIVS